MAGCGFQERDFAHIRSDGARAYLSCVMSFLNGSVNEFFYHLYQPSIACAMKDTRISRWHGKLPYTSHVEPANTCSLTGAGSGCGKSQAQRAVLHNVKKYEKLTARDLISRNFTMESLETRMRYVLPKSATHAATGNQLNVTTELPSSSMSTGYSVECPRPVKTVALHQGACHRAAASQDGSGISDTNTTGGYLEECSSPRSNHRTGCTRGRFFHTPQTARD